MYYLSFISTLLDHSYQETFSNSSADIYYRTTFYYFHSAAAAAVGYSFSMFDWTHQHDYAWLKVSYSMIKYEEVFQNYYTLLMSVNAAGIRYPRTF